MTEEPNNSVECTSTGEIKPAPAELQKIFGLIVQKYEPAASAIDADLRKTTTEIFQQVILHYPNESISPEHVYKALVDAGFKYDTRPGKLEFVWLLKKKKM